MSGMVFHVDDGVYDRFMGRYATRLAPLFADFAGVEGSDRVLDVGAGTGALAAELAGRLGSGSVAAAEPSSEFITALRRRLPEVDVREAPSERMPWGDASFDVVLAQLVISFVDDADASVAEMRRLVRPGGTVALCMWADDGLDLAPPLRAARLAAAPEGPPIRQLPNRGEAELRRLLEVAGMERIETTTLKVSSEYASFDEFWNAARHMRGPDTLWMQGLDDDGLAPGREAAHVALGKPSGAFTLGGRASAARAVRA